jgi:hypothetical protein
MFIEIFFLNFFCFVIWDFGFGICLVLRSEATSQSSIVIWDLEFVISRTSQFLFGSGLSGLWRDR